MSDKPGIYRNEFEKNPTHRTCSTMQGIMYQTMNATFYSDFAKTKKIPTENSAHKNISNQHKALHRKLLHDDQNEVILMFL